jgi:hypothetical protein
MPTPDKPLVRHLLGILIRIGAQTIEHAALKAELEAAADRPLSTQAYAELLDWCQGQGLILSRFDQFGDRRWWLTESGRTVHAGM